jgi:hypothetical protein
VPNKSTIKTHSSFSSSQFLERSIYMLLHFTSGTPDQRRYQHSTPYGLQGSDGVYRFNNRTSAAWKAKYGTPSQPPSNDELVISSEAKRKLPADTHSSKRSSTDSLPMSISSGPTPPSEQPAQGSSSDSVEIEIGPEVRHERAQKHLVTNLKKSTSHYFLKSEVRTLNSVREKADGNWQEAHTLLPYYKVASSANECLNHLKGALTSIGLDAELEKTGQLWRWKGG